MSSISSRLYSASQQSAVSSLMASDAATKYFEEGSISGPQYAQMMKVSAAMRLSAKDKFEAAVSYLKWAYTDCGDQINILSSSSK